MSLNGLNLGCRELLVRNVGGQDIGLGILMKRVIKRHIALKYFFNKWNALNLRTI